MAKVKIPKASWWKAHNMPLKQIPMDRKELKNLSDDDKTIAAMATWPSIIKILIGAAIVYVLFAVFYFAFSFSSDASFGSSLQNLIILIVVALFLAPKPTALLDGFETIKGYERLGINTLIALLIMLFTIPMRLVGIFANMILSLINRVSQSSMLGMPRICLPQNCDYDSLIGYYSEYEKQAVSASNYEMAQQNTTDIVSGRASDLRNEINELENNNEMDSYEKSKLISEKKDLLYSYEKTLDALSNDINDPEYKEKLEDALHSVENSDSYAASDLKDVLNSYDKYENSKKNKK